MELSILQHTLFTIYEAVCVSDIQKNQMNIAVVLTAAYELIWLDMKCRQKTTSPLKLILVSPCFLSSCVCV